MELPCYSSISPNEITEPEIKNSSTQKLHTMEELETSDDADILTQIRTKLGNKQELLDNFLDARELLGTATEQNLAIVQRNFRRAKNALGARIS
jgi:hypothetical protein